MPQDPNQNPIDLNKILLPKKEVRTSASAERVNAGALLEQETQASVTGIELPPAPPVATPPLVSPERPSVPALETFKGDIESVIQNQNVSMVTIAAAEAARGKGAQTPGTDAPQGPTWVKQLIYIVGGILFISLAAAVVAFVALKPEKTVTPTLVGPAPFVAVDDSTLLVFEPKQLTRSTLVEKLQKTKEESTLAVGLIHRISVALSSTTKDAEPVVLEAPRLLRVLAPQAPEKLLRTLDLAYYLIGVHIFDERQGFFVLYVDSYEQAFAGMLEWEDTIVGELAPFISRTPRPKLGQEIVASSTTTSPQIFTGVFADRIVENHDTRVVQNAAGDILFLWTFLDRNTLVITTNEYTLRELINRLRSASLSPTR